MNTKKSKSILGVIFTGLVTVLFALLLDGCSHRVTPGPLVAPAFPARPNVKVHWDRPEFLYTDALDAPITFPINLDGTLIPPMSRYGIDEMRPIPA